jgi:hypothetical protein
VSIDSGNFVLRGRKLNFVIERESDAHCSCDLCFSYWRIGVGRRIDPGHRGHPTIPNTTLIDRTSPNQSLTAIGNYVAGSCSCIRQGQTLKFSRWIICYKNTVTMTIYVDPCARVFVPPPVVWNLCQVTTTPNRCQTVTADGFDGIPVASGTVKFKYQVLWTSDRDFLWDSVTAKVIVRMLT